MNNTYSVWHKVTSGRRFLVYVIGINLVLMTGGVMYGMLSAWNNQLFTVWVALFGQLITLFTIGVKYYFDKEDRKDHNGNGQEASRSNDEARTPPTQ